MPPNKRGGGRLKQAIGLHGQAPPTRPRFTALPLQLLPSCFAACASSARMQRNRDNAPLPGRLLRSAWQEVILQRRHCLSKDWPYSQADTQVCDFRIELLILGDCVMLESGGASVGLQEARFEALEMSADALRRRRWSQQCC